MCSGRRRAAGRCGGMEIADFGETARAFTFKYIMCIRGKSWIQEWTETAMLTAGKK